MYLARGNSNSLLAHFGSILSLVLLISLLHGIFVAGSPLDRRQDDSIDPDDPSSDVDSPLGPLFSALDPALVNNYPDLDTCRKNCNVARDKSVFYSKVGHHEEKPQMFADQLPEGVLMRKSFPSGFADKNPEYTGYKGFMERTSRAFAEKTSGVAYVLLPTDGNTDISKSVWTTIEKPVLMATDGECIRIIKVDPEKFDSQCKLWVRDGNDDANLPNCNAENGPTSSNTPAPNPSPVVVAPVDPPSQPSCVPNPTDSVKDAHEDELNKAANYFCDQHATDTNAKAPIDIAETVMASTDLAFAFTYPPSMGNQDDVYDLSIKNVPNCTPEGGFNLATPVANNQCADILHSAWKNCGNQGRGGDITAGCLVYSVRTKY